MDIKERIKALIRKKENELPEEKPPTSETEDDQEAREEGLSDMYGATAENEPESGNEEGTVNMEETEGDRHV